MNTKHLIPKNHRRKPSPAQNDINIQNIYKKIEPFLKKNQLFFKQTKYITRAFIHSSYWNEHSGLTGHDQDNEKLEFLGDAILGFIVNEYLFNHFPHFNEGELAKIKNNVVSEMTLSAWARKIDVGTYLQMSKGEMSCGGNQRDSILADAMEALIAAIYLDQGMDGARKFVLSYLVDVIDNVQGTQYKQDYKSYLQEFTQKEWACVPEYKVMEERGPEHDKLFVVHVFVQDKKMGEGQGPSKKKAEQHAAADALENKIKTK